MLSGMSYRGLVELGKPGKLRARFLVRGRACVLACIFSFLFRGRVGERVGWWGNRFLAQPVFRSPLAAVLIRLETQLSVIPVASEGASNFGLSPFLRSPSVHVSTEAVATALQYPMVVVTSSFSEERNHDCSDDRGYPTTYSIILTLLEKVTRRASLACRQT